MNFEELQAKLAQQQQVLAKSMGAAEGGNDDDDDDDDDDGNGGGEGGTGGEGGGEPLTKSFTLTLEDGTTLEAVDGTEMVKSLAAKLNATEAARSADAEQMMKSFGATVDLISSLTDGLAAANASIAELKKENETLKASGESFKKSLEAFGSQGRGRRSADVVVNGRPPVAATGSKGQLSAPEILAKAQDALKAGRISGSEATKVQTAINMGLAPDSAILDRLNG